MQKIKYRISKTLSNGAVVHVYYDQPVDVAAQLGHVRLDLMGNVEFILVDGPAEVYGAAAG